MIAISASDFASSPQTLLAIAFSTQAPAAGTLNQNSLAILPKIVLFNLKNMYPVENNQAVPLDLKI
ncbi:MAG: hypothetical protein KME19_22630 [Microcoleus vaginatus WJT46-NPBG5]|nr:hypothetical protein [Microcoleus vaginatus WJT46-NPBG5]